MITPHRVFAAAVCLVGLTACVGPNSVFVPRSDFGVAPEAERYTEPGDCRGGSRLRAIDLTPPDYGRRAFRTGQQGWVVARLDVRPDGRIGRVEIVDAAPWGPFNANARKAVKRWRFAPPGEDGLNRCIVVLDFRFGEARVGL